MSIILKRSVLENFTAPVKWVSFLHLYSPGTSAEKAMEKLSVDETLVINRKGKSDSGSDDQAVLPEGRGLCSLLSAGHTGMIAQKPHNSTVQREVSHGRSCGVLLGDRHDCKEAQKVTHEQVLNHQLVLALPSRASLERTAPDTITHPEDQDTTDAETIRIWRLNSEARALDDCQEKSQRVKAREGYK
jgi:hypothetical protein